MATGIVATLRGSVVRVLWDGELLVCIYHIESPFLSLLWPALPCPSLSRIQQGHVN